MPASQRLEFRRREDNIVYPTAFHMHRVHRGGRLAGSIEEIMCNPAAGPRVRIAAVPCQDSMLMVGG